MTDSKRDPDGLRDLMDMVLGERGTPPKMDDLLQALDDTREFLEARYAAALDEQDRTLADAYRYVLTQLRGSILNDALVRGMVKLGKYCLTSGEKKS